MNKILLVILMAILPVASFAEPMSKEQGDAILKELHEIRQVLEKQAPAQRLPAPDERVTVDVSGIQSQGRVDAPLVMVMFTDYQCPFCRRFEMETMPEIKRQYVDTGKLRFMVRDMPLDIHPNAQKAAEATHCAADQGKYWELRKKLIENSEKLEAANLPGYARETGLDVKKFSVCLNSGRYAEMVKASALYAAKLNITGTPSFVIGKLRGDKVDGVKMVGAMPYAMFDQKLKELANTK